MLSAILLQPADLLKTRIQQSRTSSLFSTLAEIRSGPSPLKQLWRGTLPSILRTGFGSAIYFTSLNALRQGFARSALSEGRTVRGQSSSTLPQLSPLENLTTGAISRAFAGAVLMPVTVIKIRYESSLYSYQSIWGAGSAIFRSEGFKGFFVGFGATTVRDALIRWSIRSFSTRV